MRLRAFVIVAATLGAACSRHAPVAVPSVSPMMPGEGRVIVVNGAGRAVHDFHLTAFADGDRAFLVNDLGAITVFDVPSMRERLRLPTGQLHVEELWAGRGSVFVVRSDNRDHVGALEVFDARRGVLVSESRKAGYGAYSSYVFALAADGNRFAMADAQGRGVIYVDLASGARRNFDAPSGAELQRLWFEDGKLVADWRTTRQAFDVGRAGADAGAALSGDLVGGPRASQPAVHGLTDARCDGIVLATAPGLFASFAEATKTLCLVDAKDRQGRVLATRTLDIDVTEGRFAGNGTNLVVAATSGQMNVVLAVPSLEPRARFAGLREAAKHTHLDEGAQDTLVFLERGEAGKANTLHVVGTRVESLPVGTRRGDSFASADGRWFTWEDADATHLLDTSTMTSRTLALWRGERTEITFSADGKTLVATSRAGHLRAFETATAKVLGDTPPPARAIASLGFTSSNELTFLSADDLGENAAIQSIRGATRSQKPLTPPPHASFGSALILPHGEPLARWRELAKNGVVPSFTRGTTNDAVKLDTEDGEFFSSTADGSVILMGGRTPPALWKNGALEKRFEDRRSAEIAAISPDGTTLVFAGSSISVTTRDGKSIAEIADADARGDWYALAFTRSGKQFVAKSYKRAVIVETATGKVLRDWPLDGYEYASPRIAAISADARFVAFNGPLRVLDAQADAPAPPARKVDDEMIISLAFSPDGKLLATGTAEGTVQIRAAADATLLASVRASSDSTGAVVFTPAGKIDFLGDAAAAKRYVVCQKIGSPAILPYESCGPAALEPGLLTRLLP